MAFAKVARSLARPDPKNPATSPARRPPFLLHTTLFGQCRARRRRRRDRSGDGGREGQANKPQQSAYTAPRPPARARRSFGASVLFISRRKAARFLPLPASLPPCLISCLPPVHMHHAAACCSILGTSRRMATNAIAVLRRVRPRPTSRPPPAPVRHSFRLPQRLLASIHSCGSARVVVSRKYD